MQVHEVQAAMNAWDAAAGTTWQELQGSATLTTSQRKLLAHATTEVRASLPPKPTRPPPSCAASPSRTILAPFCRNQVRLAKRAWTQQKMELRAEREKMAHELREFSRALVIRAQQVRIAGVNGRCG